MEPSNTALTANVDDADDASLCGPPVLPSGTAGRPLLMVRSKKEIAQWASGAAGAGAHEAYDDDDELNPHRPSSPAAGSARFPASRSDDWPAELEALAALVRSPKIATRTCALHHYVPLDAARIESSKQRAQLVLLLVDAGLRYDDQHSLKLSIAAAAPVLDTLFRAAQTDDAVAAQALKALLHHLALSKGAAPRARFALIAWLALVLETLSGAGPARVPGLPPSLPRPGPAAPRSHEAKEAVMLLARALDGLMGDHAAKPTVKSGALTWTRRALRAVRRPPSHLCFAGLLTLSNRCTSTLI